ncbi:unnamed protein product [[Candida] boidinii]|nr:unnamed protein product [[Candida] boidinii]
MNFLSLVQDISISVFGAMKNTKPSEQGNDEESEPFILISPSPSVTINIEGPSIDLKDSVALFSLNIICNTENSSIGGSYKFKMASPLPLSNKAGFNFCSSTLFVS